ncbi:MAG: 6-phosphofructokinase [Spirochaetes bacterium RIFOXYC1_FULL_54_7]|nr:MAG: 6-phosphofructokinase [Spirochaetes bacterium RIFOXYC1_FULL_54_7]
MDTMKGKCIVAQSGGPTAVINASACGVIQEALKSPPITGVYAAHNGILGIMNEELFDLGKEDPADIEGLRTTPAAALGSCRYKVKTEEDYRIILDVFKKHDVRYFFYIGGNDSMDTADKVNRLALKEGYEFRAMGVPKTVDNDLAFTDHCPGYGSVIKYLAAMVMEAGRDTEALYTTDTVNVIEAMGRNAGWIAAGTALAKRSEEDAPHIILLPEVPFDPERFKARVQHYLDTIKRCVIVVSEGTKYPDGSYIAEQKGEFAKDAFGHTQLGGAANFIKAFVEHELKVKARFAIPSTVQRAGMHFASLTDSQEAYLTGQTAVKLALAGESGKMVTLVRGGTQPYTCTTGLADLSAVANGEKLFPREWISKDGYSVTEEFIRYARPLIMGEVAPVMEGGLPRFIRFKKHFVK